MPAIRIEIQGQSFDAPLPEVPVSIGKAEDADLRIQGDGVAGHHCVLEPLGGGRTKLKDLGSGQETLVNGVAIKQISLNDGDVIEVGSARITYLATAAGAPAQTAAVEPPFVEAVPARPAPAKPKPAVRPASAAQPKAAGEPPQLPTPSSPPKPGSGTTAAPAAEPSTREATAASADAPAASSDGRRRKTKSPLPLVGLLAGVVVLVGVMVFSQGVQTSDDSSYADALKEGHRLLDAKDYDAARIKFQRVEEGAPGGGTLKGQASDGLALVAAVERAMDAHLQRLKGERLVLTRQTLSAERTRFLESYGHLQEARFDRAKAAIQLAQSQWKSQNVEATGFVAADLIEKVEFAQARAVWQKLGAKSPAAIDVTTEVEAALEALGVTAAAQAETLLQRAAAWNKGGMPYRSVKLFDDMLPRFEGFPAEAKFKEARARAAALKSVPVPTQPSKPRPTKPRPTRPDPTRPESARPDPTRPDPARPDTPPTDPTVAAAQKKRADLLITDAAAEADARRFRDGAAKLAAGARAFPEGTQRARLLGLAEDYGLAAKGKDLLIAHIKAAPERYGSVRIAPRLKVDLIDADAEYLHAKVSGGRSKHAWARLPASVWPGFVKRQRAGREAAVPAAALLHAVGQTKAAEAALVVATEKGVPTAEVFAILARWRGMEVPEGGFVIHDGRYVTPTERDDLVREAQILAALTKLDSKKSEERKAAADALIALGDAAAPRFKQALESRRAFLTDALVRSKSFTSGKYKSKLLQLLAERRKHALVLIYDAQAYPYPNKSKKAQADVEARVDKVREVWERSFDLVAQWDSKLQARLQGITEVDEFLARVDPAFRPDLDVLKDRINKAIDVPSVSDPGKREYSLQVLVYNTTLKTTATGQEKQNVRSVNEYRMMMGLLAVKIDEKLTRAARGHSRHMATNQYFAHNVPAPYAKPTNRTPGVRAKQQGFGGGVGENIARGPGTGHGAFMAWFRSSGHHRNMLGRGWLVMGCGRAATTWWTQLFGGGSKSLKEPDPLPAPAKPFAPDPEGKGAGGGSGGGDDETGGGG